jgi:hypothetical protein
LFEDTQMFNPFGRLFVGIEVIDLAPRLVCHIGPDFLIQHAVTLRGPLLEHLNALARLPPGRLTKASRSWSDNFLHLSLSDTSS